MISELVSGVTKVTFHLRVSRVLPITILWPYLAKDWRDLGITKPSSVSNLKETKKASGDHCFTNGDKTLGTLSMVSVKAPSEDWILCSTIFSSGIKKSETAAAK
eukprot:Lithocolla_globosa_v1_NODE_6771_length_1037_cov_8.634420.p2 type:complete len:104 gc:universal NODE_6771_length_1037_cov_8.634420:126-437(+)